MTRSVFRGGAPAPVALDGVPFDPAAFGIAHFEHRASVGSTMDVAHALAAAGAPHATLVVADRQEAGRGRAGKRWHSNAPTGLWMTWLLRDVRVPALEVLSLRVGLAVADAVAPWTDGVAGLKWPNDVLTAAAPSVEAARTMPVGALAKLAGILVETRWREGQLEWVAIGVGINLQLPPSVVDPSVVDASVIDASVIDASVADGAPALRPSALRPPALRPSALRAGASRAALLSTMAAPVLASGQGRERLTDSEAARWRALDLMVGRRATQPMSGLVLGVTPHGSLMVRGDDGVERHHRSGSLEVAS